MDLRQHSYKLWLVALTLAVVAGLFAPPASASGRRVSVQIDEPFVIGGQHFAAGKLTLREVRDFNPTATLTEVRVDGRSLGVMLAKEEAGQVSTRQDQVIFERSRNGDLVLVSLALKGEPVRRLYTLGHVDSPRQWQAIARQQPTLVASVK